MPLWAPPWAGWFLFIISLNPHSLCNEVGSVSPSFSWRKPRLGRVTGLRRGGGRSWTPWVCLQSPQCWDRHSRPFQQCSPAMLWGLGCPHTSLGAPASALCPQPWQPAQVPVGVSPRRQGVAGRMGLGWKGGVGSGFILQPGVGAGAPAAMRYPPRECGPAAPPSESSSEHPANRLLCSWLATHLPPLKGWHLGAGQPVVATPCSA